MSRVPVLALGALSGCLFTNSTTGDTGPVDDWQPVSYVDEGDVCFQSVAGEVQVEIRLPGVCLSGSCSRDFSGTCAATVKGSDVTLTSDMHWEQNVGEGVPCTEDCGLPLAHCSLGALADGTFSVTFGAETLTLTVPATDKCPYLP